MEMFHIPPNLINSRNPGFQQEWSIFQYPLGFFRKEQIKSSFILFYAVWAVVLWAYIPQAPRLFTLDASGNVVLTQLVPPGTTLSFSERLVHLLKNSQQLWGALVLFGLLPTFFVKVIFREKLSDYGVSFGIPYRVRNLSLILLPLILFVLWLIGKNPVYFGSYPYNPWILGGFSSIAEGRTFLVIYFTLYILVYYVSWEFFFRGFLLLGLENSVGCFNAILIGTAISTLAHLGPHAMAETIGAIGGGILWGFFVYRSRSIIPGIVTHASLGLCLDYFLLYYFLPF